MQNSRKLELGVGAFVIAGFVALLVLVVNVANVTSFSKGETYTLKAEFSNIGGLQVRSPVKVGGVVIGRVSKIELDPETYLPVISMDINQSVGYFPDTSSASILTAGLLGEQYIGILPGFVDDDIDMLGDGDTLYDTKPALVLEDMIGQVLYSMGSDK
uniref:outer membrane lipid asymmetry maintenance protein MlaD n=1 Tax=Thaumasiovibrio occultus TaxID=1891184 RepID=UPI000B35BA60|nr:outer membrane lipid asymmetry maintenance protein MlaD [Thaumasiovibrio occultus]